MRPIATHAPDRKYAVISECASLVLIMVCAKFEDGFYQTSRMSFTDLKFAVENDEKESQCP